MQLLKFRVWWLSRIKTAHQIKSCSRAGSGQLPARLSSPRVSGGVDLTASRRPARADGGHVFPQITANPEDAAESSDRGITFAINFPFALREIINETKYLEQLGFPIPELARNVALQEDKFLRYRPRLPARGSGCRLPPPPQPRRAPARGLHPVDLIMTSTYQ